MNKIAWTHQAKKDLKKIPNKYVVNIINAIDGLSKSQIDWVNTKKLINHQHDYRMRCGDYRIIFDLEKVAKIIHIEKIRRKDGRTY